MQWEMQESTLIVMLEGENDGRQLTHSAEKTAVQAAGILRVIAVPAIAMYMRPIVSCRYLDAANETAGLVMRHATGDELYRKRVIHYDLPLSLPRINREGLTLAGEAKSTLFVATDPAGLTRMFKTEKLDEREMPFRAGCFAVFRCVQGPKKFERPKLISFSYGSGGEERACRQVLQGAKLYECPYCGGYSLTSRSGGYRCNSCAWSFFPNVLA